MFSPLYLKIFEKSPFLMKTPTQNFAHHTEVKKHPFGVKTPILATLLGMSPSVAQNKVVSQSRVFNNSELKHAHFRILPEKVPILAKNVRFLYYREANKKRHPPLKVAPMSYKVHIIEHSVNHWLAQS